ncbi:hypothetical protein [Sicyoidochytrium minutum DNA virus]|nr:hypothetical protein [Sicyoidochytrium minutum DNA virus]
MNSFCARAQKAYSSNHK